MITPEEIGTIITRLAIADEQIVGVVLSAAQKTEEGLLPNDLDKLLAWAKFVKIIRTRKIQV